MAITSTGRLLWMIALTAIVSAEKLLEKPRRAMRGAAVVLGVGAVGAGVVAVLG